ncbi:MAG TPA: LysR family transcriptional regulator [Rickettsiales bacterium]|nr:LysR family transcriptional regulator [Rickettsiales bacterium]
MQKDINFYYKKNRLSQIRGFCSVVQNDYSIAAAHRKTHVEAATISKEIRTLENDLGVQLLDRSGYNKLKLTKEGELFYKEAIKYVNGIDSLVDTFNENLKEFNSNHLNLALHYTAMSYVFPKILGKLLEQKRFKNLNIKLFDISKEEAIKKLINKEVDMAFYHFNASEKILSEIEVEKNIKNSYVLIYNKNHPLANKKIILREDVKDYNFLLRNETSFKDISKYLDLRPSKITFENAKIETTIELVKYTSAITTISEIAFNEGDIRLDSNIVKINVDNLFPESYFYTMKLKNSLKKDSVNFIVKELNELVIKK